MQLYTRHKDLKLSRKIQMSVSFVYPHNYSTHYNGGQILSRNDCTVDNEKLLEVWLACKYCTVSEYKILIFGIFCLFCGLVCLPGPDQVACKSYQGCQNLLKDLQFQGLNTAHKVATQLLRDPKESLREKR